MCMNKTKLQKETTQQEFQNVRQYTIIYYSVVSTCFNVFNLHALI